MDLSSLSRIDRAVAENIKDIQRSFGGQAGIVQDFIVFTLSARFKPPVIEGFAFQTVLDYALYSMMERNISFSSRYEVWEKDTVLQMHSLC